MNTAKKIIVFTALVSAIGLIVMRLTGSAMTPLVWCCFGACAGIASFGLIFD